MEIEIEIDSLTDCLIERSSGKLLDTEFRLVAKTITKEDSEKLKAEGWKFDWSIPHQDNCEIYAITLKDSTEIEGYVQFVAKTALVEHYQKTLNAKLIDAQRMYIDSEGAVELIKKYFPQED